MEEEGHYSTQYSRWPVGPLCREDLSDNPKALISPCAQGRARERLECETIACELMGLEWSPLVKTVPSLTCLAKKVTILKCA